MNMLKIEREKIDSPQEPYRFTKRLGSTVYEVNVYFNQDAKERMEDKILRLIRNDYDCSQKNGTMELPQMNRLPERSST